MTMMDLRRYLTDLGSASVILIAIKADKTESFVNVVIQILMSLRRFVLVTLRTGNGNMFIEICSIFKK
jgi:hypothetical protein